MRPWQAIKALTLISCSLLLYFHPAKAQCFSTAWRNATIFTTDNSIGIYDFSSPGNAQTSNNTRASAASLISILSGDTYYLKATGFGFTVPSYASICGVTVEIECRATGLLLTAAIRDNEVKIIKNGTITGTDHALGGDWGSSDGYRSYGGTSDLWGTTLNPADVNSSNFGIAISASIIALIAALPDAEIDHIRMRIDYNPVLPVTLEYFTATKKEDLVNLEWKTAEEENGSFIYLQRSEDNTTWNDIGRYELHLHNTYKVYKQTDTVSLNKSYQYRLKTTLASGLTTYSTIKHFAAGTAEKLVLYPNPAVDRIVITGKNIRIVDMMGRQHMPPSIVDENGSVFFLNSLPPGVYFAMNERGAEKFIKQ
jgi:hypothetical protein